MFPTGVGMNRFFTKAPLSEKYVPHRRGDEPLHQVLNPADDICFPTGVGMNRGIRAKKESLGNVPHRRGDEPDRIDKESQILIYSPQAWG